METYTLQFEESSKVLLLRH